MIRRKLLFEIIQKGKDIKTTFLYGPPYAVHEIGPHWWVGHDVIGISPALEEGTYFL